ncbi:MAG TPA: FkbM family methyltransferase [Nitrospirales bacterium]|nr:FkbM family methyltransferase [Nitrospirales bacterium]
MLRARILTALIQLLRLYVRYSPLQKGRWRVSALIYACANRVPRDYHIVIQSNDGRRFLVAPAERQYHMDLLDRGVFEPDVSAEAARWLRPGAVAIDAGANFGWYATLFSKLVGSEGQVHAFEPIPHTAAALAENCRLNDCGNVRINRLALGEQKGEVTIYLNPRSACGDASMYPASSEDARPTRCTVTTLDAYMAETGLTRCDFIKCDVEGAELECLRGARGLLSRFRPVVVVEINPSTLARARCTGEELLLEIGRHGEYVFELIGDGNGTRPKYIAPHDCSMLKSYANVVCYPKSMAM